MVELELYTTIFW